ncbi:hypothetical protein HGRIS_005905 [Hohenbuehelia grisea]|uniref:Protein kinase domain-containing protein n=1 Tax=Hohenbuehelia grisea TaxID=104357 RepID=A0ABR3K0Q1_9AGAR
MSVHLAKRFPEPPIADLSPPDTIDDTDSSSTSSGSTVEDIDVYPLCNFGHPLQRMVGVQGAFDEDSEFMCYSRYSACSSDSESSITSSAIYDIDFEGIVDDYLAQQPLMNESRKLIMVQPSSEDSADAFMIKHLPCSCSELRILEELKDDEARLDPWNPMPHILSTVKRDNDVYLCMERLFPYNHPPFRTVANYMDFFKQVLEGLTFLHENNITQLSYHTTDSFMIDIGRGSRKSTTDSFDRTAYPVRYYYTDFEHARKFDSYHPSDHALFEKDVRDCGLLISSLLIHIPRVATKLKSLVNGMISGGFAADDSRKLFEALCKSLDSSVFDAPIVP